RFKEHAAGYLRFLGERIEPTNNVAERALRHCVIDRKVTQGTRGETGERWCERAWTAVMTCRKHAGRPSSYSSMPCGPIPTAPQRHRC
ncbi:MAG: transposase, partial [Planctomycetes bacterium]|nr:transposase [Planctomycetota bacterium]